MTTLAQSPVDEFDMLALIADGDTPLSMSFADRFRAACLADAQAHDGEVNPNRVRAAMLAGGKFSAREVRQYAGIWSKAAGLNGYLDVERDSLVPIDPEHSKRNGNKSVPLRRWRGWGE